MHIETHHPIMTEITLINGDLFPLAVVHRRAKGGKRDPIGFVISQYLAVMSSFRQLVVLSWEKGIVIVASVL